MGCESGEELFEQTLEEGKESLDLDQKKSTEIPTNKPHACDFEGCNARFNRPYRLKQHLRVHKGERPFNCEHTGCKKSYTSNAHLQRHILGNHSTASLYKKSFRCNFPGCGLSIRHEGNLRRHYNRAHGPKQQGFQCGQCPRSFAKNRQLMAHSFEHTGVAPFRCVVCDKGFMRERLLHKHKRTHHADYRCDVPGCSEVEGFEKWADICRHRRTHHPIMFECAMCGHTVPCKSRLKVHINSHLQKTEKEVFVCPYDDCSRYYYYKKNLQTHINLVHEGKRFECPHEGCTKSLSCKAKLRWHLRMHEPGYDSGRKYPRGPDRKLRKDAANPKRSWAAKLSGAQVSLRYEKSLVDMPDEDFDIPSPYNSLAFTDNISDKKSSDETKSQPNNFNVSIKEEQISD